MASDASAEKKLIYLITPGELPGVGAERRLYNIVRLAVDLQIPLIQLRERSLTVRELCRIADDIVALTRGTSTKLLINDRADIAAAVGADGVHLTSRSLSAKTVRSSFPHLLIGVSTHDRAELSKAFDDRADFAVFGPVFASPGKGEPVGLVELNRVCRLFPGFPVLGLGGIDENNFDDVMESEAAGIAAIRLFNDPSTLIRLVSCH